jgi:hypothetical protein
MVASARRRHARTSAAGKHLGSQSEVEGCEATGSGLNFTPHDASSYVLSMIAELRSIAVAAEFRFLAYLLEMAFQEAYRLDADIGREGKSKAQETSSAI